MEKYTDWKKIFAEKIYILTGEKNILTGRKISWRGGKYTVWKEKYWLTEKYIGDAEKYAA